MNVSLGADAERIIRDKLKSGRYQSAEDVILAALRKLEPAAEEDFAAGELDRLLAEGENSIREEGTVSAEEVFVELRRRGNLRQGKRR